MKPKKFVLFLMILVLFCTPFFSINLSKTFALNDDCYEIEGTNEMLSNDYLDFYAVPNTKFSASNNGGEVSGGELSKAFDRNFNTFFKSSQDNNVDYIDEITGETKHNFINTIDVTFSQSVKLDKILYACEIGITRGYPTNLNLYYNTGNGFELIKNYQTSETTNFVVFEFGETIEMTSFRFEFVKVSTRHKYCATATEIIFLQPESQDYFLYKNLFSDYSETKVNKNLNTIKKLENFEKRLNENINFQTSNKKIERAKNVLSGEIKFDENREFSTKQNAKNKIERLGNLESYARNTLKLAKFGTNRQVLGISANAESEITIYVSGNRDDPLPKIRFSQHLGHWRSWMGNEIQLSLGKNTFSVPSFYHEEYTIDCVLGGPIYLVNPYSESEQSENVKIYVEGGNLYPIFKTGMDEQKYLNNLNNYCEQVNLDPDNVVNVTEIVSDHTIITVNATKAKEIYANFSPNQTILNWNEYMDKLLNFGGVYQDENNPLFNEKNLNLKVNIRVVQPWTGGWMFAAGEHIGVQESSQSTLIYAQNFGWGVTHEIGHMLDINERTVSETTNNMWSKFNETEIENVGTRGNFDVTLSTLSNDLKYNETDYFVTYKQNYLIWWYIEAWQKGYWANLENCYRGLHPKLNQFIANFDSEKTLLNSLTPSEKQVFFSSLITGIDLSYYFERWGFSINNNETDPVFKTSTASQSFKTLMELLTQNNFVDSTKKPKLWYQNSKQYYTANTTSEYSQNTTCSIENVYKTNSGYNIFINKIYNDNHLGFEIWEGNDIDGLKIIGFCYDRFFQDTTIYNENYTPTYKIVAIDNTFSESKISDAKSVYENSEYVCKIDDNFFTSFSCAITEALDNDIIEILKPIFTENLEIDKNLTIKLSDNVSSDIQITKIESGNLFVINAGKTLTLKGNNDNYLILNGNNFTQNGALINVFGTLNGEKVKFFGNFSTNIGAGIILQDNSKNSSISNCVFNNLSALNGSALSMEYAQTSLTISNSNFENNISQNGAIILNKGTLNLNDSTVSNNNSNTVIKNYEGGVLRVNGLIISQNQIASNGYIFYIDGLTEIKNTNFIENFVINEQTNQKDLSLNLIFYQAGNIKRTLLLENFNIENNLSKNLIFVENSVSNLSLINVKSENTNICFEIKSGNVKINSDCDLLVSKFNLNKNTNIVLSGGLFENFEKISLEIEDFSAGMTIFSAENFDLTESYDEILSRIQAFTTQENKKVKIELEIKDNTIVAYMIFDNENNLKLIIIISIIALILIYVLAIIFIKNHRKKKKQKRLLALKNNINNINDNLKS